MKSDNLEPVPWRTYADDEWARFLAANKDEDEPWQPIPVELLNDRPGDHRWFALIALAVIVVCVVLTIAWWGE